MQRLKRRLCILFIFISSRNVNILDRVDAKHRAVEPSLAPLTRPLNHRGRSEDGAVYTYTLWMANDSLNRALNSIFKCLLFFQTLLNPASKGIYNVNEGGQSTPELRFRPCDISQEQHTTPPIPKGMFDNPPAYPHIHAGLTPRAPGGFLKSAASFNCSVHLWNNSPAPRGGDVLANG